MLNNNKCHEKMIKYEQSSNGRVYLYRVVQESLSDEGDN